MAEGQELAVVRLLVQSIMDRVVANECAGTVVQSSPVSVAQNGHTEIIPEQHGLAPSPASALANALSELTLQTPLRQRPSPEIRNGMPAVSSAVASTPQSAEVVAGVPSKGVLNVAPPAKARGADRSIGLCYDRIMEAHVGPAGRSSAIREQHMHGGDDVWLCKLVSSLSTRRFVVLKWLSFKRLTWTLCSCCRRPCGAANAHSSHYEGLERHWPGGPMFHHMPPPGECLNPFVCVSPALCGILPFDSTHIMLLLGGLVCLATDSPAFNSVSPWFET